MAAIFFGLMDLIASFCSVLPAPSSPKQLTEQMGAVHVGAMVFDAIATLPLPKFCYFVGPVCLSKT